MYVFQSSHLWIHDHICEHSEDVAITCTEYEEEDSRNHQTRRETSSRPGSESTHNSVNVGEVTSAPLINSQMLAGGSWQINPEEECGVVRVSEREPTDAIPRVTG